MFFGFFESSCGFFLAVSLLTPVLLGYFSAPLWLWTLALLTFLVGWQAPWPLILFFFIMGLLFNVPLARRFFVSNFILSLFKKFQLVPRISETERVALEAGVVWIESELFSGKPNFKKIMKEPFRPSAK